MPLPSRISVTPDPPEGGRSMEVCYDFSGSGLESAALDVSFDPGETTRHTVTPQDPCFTIEVPGNADTYLIEDMSGQSADKGGSVQS